MNISFVKLGECERCDLHDKHLEDIHKLDKHELSKPDENGKNRKPTFVDCADCVDFELHIKTATEARERYREEKNREWTDNEKVVSVDMQKVIMLPRLPGLMVVVFCKCIVVFNETFAPVGGSKNEKDKATGVLWDEGIRGQSAADVASTFVSFIRKNRDTKGFISFWLDNCSAQNKNWYLYKGLPNEVNSEGGHASLVTLKYFEPGHTFMSADNFHHQVEQRMRQKKNVKDFLDFVDVVSSCGQSLVMKCNDFFDFRKGVSQANYTREKPKLEQVQVIKFERGRIKMFWKESHKSESFKSSKFLQKKYKINIGTDFN